MTWPVSHDVVDFEQATKWLRDRAPMLRGEWDALTAEAKEKAFTVAGVAQLDLVAEVWRAVDTAVAHGGTLEEFKKAVGQKLDAAWSGSVDDPPWRLETIFRTNTQLAYSRGRHEQMTDPDVLRARPYWMFDAIEDGRTTRICSACDGKVLRADHPFWTDHVPPLHFNCRSAITTLSAEQADDMGITTHAPTVKAEDGFGDAPPGAGETDAEPWIPKAADYPRELWAAYEQKGGAGDNGEPPQKPPAQGGGGDEPPKRHPARERFAIPPTASIVRDSGYTDSKHGVDGPKALAALRKGDAAFVFAEGLDLVDLEAHIWQAGEASAEPIRLFDRIWLELPAPIGERRQSGRKPEPLHVAEIKGRMKGNAWVYHLVPRAKPPRKKT